MEERENNKDKSTSESPPSSTSIASNGGKRAFRFLRLIPFSPLDLLNLIFLLAIIWLGVILVFELSTWIRGEGGGQQRNAQSRELDLNGIEQFIVRSYHGSYLEGLVHRISHSFDNLFDSATERSSEIPKIKDNIMKATSGFASPSPSPKPELRRF